MRKFLSKYKIIFISFLAGFILWILEVVLDYLISESDDSLVSLLISTPPLEVSFRIFIWIALILIGWLITRHNRKITQVKQSYQTQLDNFPNGAVLFYNTDLQIQVAEGLGSRDLNLSRSQMVNKTIREIFPWETSQLIEPNCREALNGNSSVEVVPIHDQVYRVYTVPIPETDGQVQTGMVMIQDITTQIEQEIAFLESERRFQEIFEKVNLIAITLDLEGKVIFCNDYLLEQTGWNREEVLGNSWFELFIPESIKKDLQESVFLEVIESGTVQPHYINPIQTRAGEQRIISWSNIVFRSPDGKVMGTASIGEDITERENFRRELENIFEMSSDMICVAELESFQFKKINPAFESVLGYPAHELLDKPYLDFVHPDDLASTISLVEEKLNQGEKILNFSKPLPLPGWQLPLA